MCSMPPYCKACTEYTKRDLKKWVEANGGLEGLRRRAELANAYARQRSQRGERVGTISAYDLRNAYLYQGGMCGLPWDGAFCDSIPDQRWEIDHLKPISRNGENSAENIQLLCADCNKDKGNRTPYEWRNDLPARWDEEEKCKKCGNPIRGCYVLCYECKFEGQ